MSPTKASLARFHPSLLAQAGETVTPRFKGRQLLEQQSSTIKAGQKADSRDSPLPQPVSAAKAALLRDVAFKAQIFNTQGTLSQGKAEPLGESNLYKATDQTLSASQSVKHDERQELRASLPIEEISMNAAKFGSSIPEETRRSRTTSSLTESGMATAYTKPSHPPPLETKAPLESRTNNVLGPSSLSDDEVVFLPVSPPRSSIAMVEDSEPRLPSTPRQLGLEPPGSKPTGPLSISLNRKGKQPRPVGVRSSPLKPKTATPTQEFVETQSESSLGPHRPILEWWDEQNTSETTESPNSVDASLNHMLGRRNQYPEIIAKSPVSSLPAPNNQQQAWAASPLIVSTRDVKNTDDSLRHSLRSQDFLCSSTGDVFSLEIRMFVSENSGKVAFIDVIKISAWASELEAWLKAPIADRHQDAIKHAISRFWDMSETRTFCWYSCKGIFGDLVDNTEGMNAATEQPFDINKIAGDARPHKDSSTNSTYGTAFAPAHIPYHSQESTPQTVLRYLNNRSCRLRDADVSLHILWNIIFTPSGKVTSKVSASASFPPSWIENQNQTDLSRIDEAFARLVRSGTPVLAAIRCIAEVVFPA